MPTAGIRSSVPTDRWARAHSTLASMRRIDELSLQVGSTAAVRWCATWRARGWGWSAPGAAADAAVGPGSRSTASQAPASWNPEHRVYPYLLRGLTIESTESGVVRGHNLHPGAAAGSCPGGDHGLGKPASRAGVAVVQHDGHRVLPGGVGGGLEVATVFQRSSTPIRAASSPVSRSRDCWRRAGYAARWTVAVGVWTTCSSRAVALPEVRGGCDLHDLEDPSVAQRVIASGCALQRATTALGARRSACRRKPERGSRRGWRSEQERQATGMGYEGIRGRTGARAWEVPHIQPAVHRLPGPYPVTAADLDEEGRVDNQRTSQYPPHRQLSLPPTGSVRTDHSAAVPCVRRRASSRSAWRTVARN